MPVDDENMPFSIATVNLPSGETAELTLTPKDIGIAVVDYDGLFADDLERVLQFEQVTPNMIKAIYKPESLLDCFVGCFVGKDEPRALVFGGDYYMLSDFVLVDKDGQETEIEKASDSPIISESPHAVDGDGVTVELLQINLIDDDGEPFTFEGYIFKMANGQYVKLGDMSRGVITAIMADYFVAHAILNGDVSGDDMPERIAEILKKLKSGNEQPEQPEQITLAQFASKDVFVNHSLAMKVIQGIVPIAYGEASSYELTPKKGSKSGEAYKLTASEDACKSFLVDDGGNTQIMGKILETVHGLMTDEQAANFEYMGRVWFSTSKILEEVLRTQGGTVEARHSVNKKMVDDALRAASGMQIVGTSPDGKTLGVTYFVDAIKRENVTFNGNNYPDVWGFSLHGRQTVHDYARDLSQAYRYPLLATNRPLTIDQAAIERYLEDKLNEARGILYTPKGNKATKKKYTQKLSWESIFREFSPIEKMEYRRKKKLVSDFQLVLADLADMDYKNKLHEGRPLYITAYSERQAGKGSGRGKWVNLVIEYSTNLHKPKINLM